MDPYQDVRRRTLRYWYVDGLAEIAVGVVFFLLAMLFVLMGVLAPSPAVSWLLGLGQPALILLGWWGGGRAVRHFKERITYPRTGYVEYKRPRPNRCLAMLALTMVISVAVALLAASFAASIPEVWLPVFTAGPVARFGFFLGIQFGLRRFYPAATAMMLAGFLPPLLGLEGAYASALLLGEVAIVWWLSGALALRSYLRQTTPPAKDWQACAPACLS